MAIPLLAVTGGSLTARDRAGVVPLTGSGALRVVPFDGAQGFLVEEATTNYTANPRGVGSTVWGVSNASRSFVDASDHELGTAFRITAISAGNASINDSSNNTAPPTGAYTFAIDVKGYGGAVGKNVNIQINEAGGSTGTAATNAQQFTITGGWQRVKVTGTVAKPDRTNMYTIITLMGAAAGEYIDATAIQFENKPYATTYTDGSRGPGYAWTGTAHASASTRAAATLITPYDSVSSVKGSLYARGMLPSAANKYLLQVGSGDVGTDRLWIGTSNASGGISFGHRSNGGTYLAATGLFPLNVRADIYMDWDSTTVRGRASNGTIASSLREGAQGSWGASSFNIGSQVAGNQWNNVVGPVLIYDRPLTDAERATLDATPTALLGWDTLIRMSWHTRRRNLNVSKHLTGIPDSYQP